jgi:hypothetical protein
VLSIFFYGKMQEPAIWTSGTQQTDQISTAYSIDGAEACRSNNEQFVVVE